jgi:hypothetical protein
MMLAVSFKKFKRSLLLQQSLCFTLLYSVQASRVVIFSHFKPVFNIFLGFQLIKEKNDISVLLPGCSFLEKKSVFIGFDGNFKVSEKVQPTLGLALEDWAVVFSLFKVFVNFCNNFKNPLASQKAYLVKNGTKKNNFRGALQKKCVFFDIKKLTVFNSTKPLFFNSALFSLVTDFYKTDSMSLLSKNLAVSENSLKFF